MIPAICIITFGVQIMNLQMIELILFGIPWSIIFITTCYYGICSFLFHVSYFNLTCYYLIQNVERITKKLKSNMSHDSLVNTAIQIDNVNKLIYDLNRGFWKPIIMILCFSFSIPIIFNVYLLFYSEVSIVVRLVYANFVIFDFLIISLLIILPSQLSSSMSRVYLCLNRMSVKSKCRAIQTKLKVSKLIRKAFNVYKMHAIVLTNFINILLLVEQKL
jgi:hypothetical protein